MTDCEYIVSKIFFQVTSIIQKHDENSEILETLQTFQEMELSQVEVGSLIHTNKFSGWISNNVRD